MNERCTDLDAHGMNRAIARVNENEHCESCCNNSSKHDNVIKKIRYIGVDFDDAKIKKCEDDVNNALLQGYQPLERIDTPRGLIMVLGLYGRQENKIG
tara:strand:- start:567 stop:860 length:294 start_codon:yes stop_codon:yes gene_type:complete